MDSNLKSPSAAADGGDAKTTAFRKPSTDTANNRKYRRRSPVTGSSPSDGSPMHDHSSSPKFSRDDTGKVSEYQTRRRDDGREVERDSDRSCYGRSSGSYRNFDRQSSRSSHWSYHRRDDYIKHEKHADEEERNYHKLSSRSGRESRGGAHSDRIRSRDYSRRLDSDVQDGKKGLHRNSGDYRSERVSSYEESKGQLSDSISRRDESKHRMKEGYKSKAKEMDDNYLSKEQKKKYDDKETDKGNRFTRETSEQSADKDILKSENQESTAKRPKLFSSEKGIGGRKDVSKFTTTADVREPSGSKLVQEGKMTIEKTQANEADAASDINSAKVAALKAAELVNRNLVGVGPAGCMTADQKKKLLWGNKKSTTAEEAGHRWDTALFSDRERQEKFNKLMSLRLPWCLWPIVGCEGRSKGGTHTRQRRPEAEGAPNGFRKAVHCWTAKKRWSYCWIRSLSIPRFSCTLKSAGYSVALLCRSHIYDYVYDSILMHVRDNILGFVDLCRKLVSLDCLSLCKARKFR